MSERCLRFISTEVSNRCSSTLPVFLKGSCLTPRKTSSDLRRKGVGSSLKILGRPDLLQLKQTSFPFVTVLGVQGRHPPTSRLTRCLILSTLLNTTSSLGEAVTPKGGLDIIFRLFRDDLLNA